jgi:hypothetical protein
VTPLLAYGDGPWAPRADPDAVAAVAGVDDPDILLGWTVEDLPWLESLAPGRATSVSAGYRLGPAVAAGVVAVRSTPISRLPALLAGELRPDVVVVTGRRLGTGFAFGPSVGWAHAAARLARGGIVVEVRPDLPAYDAPGVPGEILATVAGPPAQPAPAGRPPSPVELAIGAAVANLIPAGAAV